MVACASAQYYYGGYGRGLYGGYGGGYGGYAVPAYGGYGYGGAYRAL